MESMFHWDGWASIDAPLVSSLFVMLLLAVIGVVVGVRARIALKNKEYLQKPKGIMFFAELYYNMCNNFASSNMGETHTEWGGYFWTRSPADGYKEVWCITSDGHFERVFCEDMTVGVRPAIFIAK